jgi:flavodoxin
MDIKVLYHSTTGNTKKVAEAIAAEAGVIAQPLTEASGSTSTDILFIGDGVY